MPLAKEWLPMEELPKPKVKPALGAILAGLGPIKTLGDKIRYYRIKNLFKQEDLAKRLGVGTSAVCQWEGDQTSPSANHLENLLRVLKISPDPTPLI